MILRSLLLLSKKPLFKISTTDRFKWISELCTSQGKSVALLRKQASFIFATFPTTRKLGGEAAFVGKDLWEAEGRGDTGLSLSAGSNSQVFWSHPGDLHLHWESVDFCLLAGMKPHKVLSSAFTHYIWDFFSGCHNKIAQTAYHKQQNILSQFWRLKFDSQKGCFWASWMAIAWCLPVFLTSKVHALISCLEGHWSC